MILEIFLYTFFYIAAILLILLVLFRPSEGSGLSGAFGGMGGDTVFGVRATQVIDKIIAGVTVVFILVAMVLAYVSAHGSPSPDEEPASRETPTHQVSELV